MKKSAGKANAACAEILIGRLCTRCKKMNPQFGNGYHSCDACRKKNRDRARLRYAKSRAKKPKKCAICSSAVTGVNRRVYCERCAKATPKLRVTMREYEAAEAGLCITCKVVKPNEGRRMCEPCAKRRRDAARRLSRVAKAEFMEQIFAHYGRACACCGETQEMFLTIDHINRDGAAKRKHVEGGPANTARYIVRNGFPSDYRILCYNCNCGRERNGGVCPHELQRNKEVT